MPSPHKSQPTTVTSNFKTIADVQKAMLAKLRESSLDAKDAAHLHLQPLTAQQVAQKLPDLTFHRAGFRIPYFELNGKPNCFYRFRYLEYDNGHGFGKLVHPDGQPSKHDRRYEQPSDTLPHVYLPPSVPWLKITKAVTVPLVITEGELKAACACKHDIPTLGLGGVWSFKSNPAGLHILPMLAKFEWAGRKTYICFDSDASQNPDVCAAEQRLAHELVNLGAEIYICRLPPLDG